MNNRGRTLFGGGVAALVATALAFLAGHDGGSSPQPPTDEVDQRVVPVAAAPEASEAPAPEESAAAALGEMLGRLYRTLEAQGNAARERVDGMVAMYRLAKAMGMSDAQIAAFVAGQARARFEQGLTDVAPTTDDMRRAMDSMQEGIIRAAEEVDIRLDLGGDFVRRVREGAQATRTGREDAIATIERGIGTARDLLRGAKDRK